MDPKERSFLPAELHKEIFELIVMKRPKRAAYLALSTLDCWCSNGYFDVVDEFLHTGFSCMINTFRGENGYKVVISILSASNRADSLGHLKHYQEFCKKVTPILNESIGEKRASKIMEKFTSHV